MSLAKTSSPPAVWDRLVCAVDGTPASLAAARAAARLMPASAQLTLCAVVDGTRVKGDADLEKRLTREAEDALERAQREIAPFHEAEVHVREGAPVGRLLAELIAERATLVAVGSPADSGPAGSGPGPIALGRVALGRVALGRVATAMLHDAPCSVLMAPDMTQRDAAIPGEVVVGFDGSGGARRALAVGRALTERLSATLRVLVATGGSMVGTELPWLTEDIAQDLALIEDSRPPVDALTAASVSAALLILGSRHLRGAPALSSVSERVAHHASCPVLVVR